jgi:hypothetical protein
MIEKKDIEHLIEAERSIRAALFPPKPKFKDHFVSPTRRAVKILCEELNWLAFERPDFWQGLRDGSNELKQYRDEQDQFFTSIRQLIDLEIGAFRKLKIKDKDSIPSISWVYNALDIVRPPKGEPTPESLTNLQNRLATAASLVCKASKGKLRRAIDGVVSLKGIRIISGATVASENLAVAHFDFGILSWKSVYAGYMVMTSDVDGLIKLLDGKDAS